MAASPSAERRFLYPVISISFISLLLFLSAISGLTASSYFLFSRLPPPSLLRRGPAALPSFAYLITGSRGDAQPVLRLLLAVYHPRNRYLLHLSHEASDKERSSLAVSVRVALPAARVFGNVDVVGKADAMTRMGTSGLAATLRAAAALMRIDREWDWFVMLNAGDYPVVSQDDLIHVFSTVPRDLNFIDHTSDLGWKETQRVHPIIVDAGIYLARRSHYFTATEKRKTPESFKFFTGSQWVILSRPFLNYCIMGWDNLPRTLLMYFTNVLLSQEGYFHSVACNSPEFQNTTVNSDLRYVEWDNPPGMDPHFLNVSSYRKIVESGVPFARQFHKKDQVLDMIDGEVLRRRYNRVTPGAWCSAKDRWWSDPCSEWGNVNSVKPGPQAEKFRVLMERLVSEWKSQSRSCK